MKKILGCLRRCIEDFDMIQAGDKIAVGLSGGKDSITLLYALKLYQRFSPKKFDLMAITLNLGIPGFNPSPLIDFCKNLGIEYTIEETYIGKIVFDIRQEKNPCSLCANMRRGALHNTAIKYGCSKVALGHHRNDAVETLLMSMFYEGRISTFSPVTHLDRKNITVIRPMLYVREGDIKGAVKAYNLPVVKNPCPANGYTKRQYIKELVQKLNHETPGIEDNIFNSISNIEQVNTWQKNK